MVALNFGEAAKGSAVEKQSLVPDSVHVLARWPVRLADLNQAARRLLAEATKQYYLERFVKAYWCMIRYVLYSDLFEPPQGLFPYPLGIMLYDLRNDVKTKKEFEAIDPNDLTKAGDQILAPWACPCCSSDLMLYDPPRTYFCTICNRDIDISGSGTVDVLALDICELIWRLLALGAVHSRLSLSGLHVDSEDLAGFLMLPLDGLFECTSPKCGWWFPLPDETVFACPKCGTIYANPDSFVIDRTKTLVSRKCPYCAAIIKEQSGEAPDFWTHLNLASRDHRNCEAWKRKFASVF